MKRTTAPAFKQAEDLKLIVPERIELNNGVVLYCLRDVKDDSVKVDIEWNAGSKYQDKSLVASFTNRMLLSGSKGKKGRQIAEEMDFYGGYTQLELDQDHAEVVIYGLVENIESIFNVFQSSFSGINFPTDELQKEKNIALNKFKVESQKVKTLCRREFNKQLYGTAPYGQVAEEQDFDNLERSDLQDYFARKYRQAPLIFITGNVSNKFIDQLREWSHIFNKQPEEPSNQFFEQTKGRVNLPMDDVMQSAIRIGRLMFDKNHPDYFKFQLLNTILGGYFGSRLMSNIREDKGYTYGIGSGMAVLQEAGYFFIGTEVGSEVRDAAIDEIFKELEILRKELIPADELTKVKNYMLGEFLRQADGPIAHMEVFKNIYFNGLATSYYSDFIRTIHSATSEELQALASHYFDRSEMLEVVVG